MLVLTRHHGEYVDLILPTGEQIRIDVLTRDSRIQIGITAPLSVKIVRSGIKNHTPKERSDAT